MGAAAWIAGFAVWAAWAAPVCAHHAQSMFDPAKRITLSGTVTSLVWANPHVELRLSVPGENGEVVEWELEGGTTAQMQRRGWRRNSVTAGDAIVVQGVHPLRSGDPRGLFGVVTRADGTRIGPRVIRDPAPASPE